MWLLIRPQKLLLNFCGKDTSQSLEHQSSSWVTREPNLKATSVTCVSSWESEKWELYHTTPRLTDKQSEPNKYWCRWLENWVKIRRKTDPSTYQNWYILTILWDQQSQDTTYILWYLGNDCAYPLTFTFPPSWAQKNTSVSITMLLTYVSDCMKPSRRHRHSPYLRQKVQRWYYDCKANTILLQPVDLVLAKADTYKGRRKVKDQWEEEPYKVECRIAEGITS